MHIYLWIDVDGYVLFDGNSELARGRITIWVGHDWISLLISEWFELIRLVMQLVGLVG